MKKSELAAENENLRTRIVMLEKAVKEQTQKYADLNKRLSKVENIAYETIEPDPIGDLARALTGVLGAAKQKVYP